MGEAIKLTMQATVRVAKSNLASYEGRRVRLVGKVVSNDGAGAVLEDAEGQQVQISKVAGPYDSQFVEVLGEVQHDHTIDTDHAIELGNEFNMQNYGELLKLIHGNRVR